MTIKNQKEWDKFVETNDDPYGSACVRYAEAWGDLMEISLSNGSTVEQCASETSHDADTEGITGFMYGCAVSMLSKCWEHGEELRRWHNVDVGGEAGEKINESIEAKVINPAVISVG